MWGGGQISQQLFELIFSPLFQITVEKQFHYTAKMTSNKHFPNSIYANHNAKLEKIFACAGQQSSLRLQNFHGGENLH